MHTVPEFQPASHLPTYPSSFLHPPTYLPIPAQLAPHSTRSGPLHLKLRKAQYYRELRCENAQTSKEAPKSRAHSIHNSHSPMHGPGRGSCEASQLAKKQAMTDIYLSVYLSIILSGRSGRERRCCSEHHLTCIACICCFLVFRQA